MQVHSDGKVRRSAEEWQEVFARFRKSGMTEAAFCRNEKIAKSSFSKRKKDMLKQVAEPSFIELKPAAMQVVDSSTSASTEMILTLPGGVTLRWKA